MTEKLPENINIYLGSNSEKVLSDASPHERYIILMNDTLQAESKKLTTRVIDLESQIEELESDNDRMEKSKTYMKGLLKNFIEMTKWYVEIGTNYEIILSGITKEINSLKYKATRHLRILQSIMIFFLGVWYEYHEITIFLPIMFVVVMLLSFQESTLWNLKISTYKSNKSKIRELSKEISDAEAAQDYIHVLIDQQ